MNDYQGYGGDDVMRGAAATGITLTGFLVGAIVGAGIALLLAPAPGGETRRRLGETVRKLGDRASDVAGRVSETASSVAERFDESESTGGTSRAGGRREPSAGSSRMPQTGTQGIQS